MIERNRTASNVLALLAAAAALYAAAGVCLTVAASFFLAVLLEPLTAWWAHRGLARKWAASLSVAVFLVSICLIGWGCWQPIARTYAQIPQYSEKIHHLRQVAETRLHRIENSSAPRAASPSNVQRVEIVGDRNSLWSSLFRATRSFLGAAGIVVFVPFLVLFGLIEKESLLTALLPLLGGEERADAIFDEISSMVRAYFLGSLIAGTVMALAQGTTYLAMGMQNAAGLGLLTGFINIIPILGLPAAFILAGAQGMLQFDTFLPFIVIACVLTAMHIFVESYIIPRVIATRVRLNSTAATLALLVWGWLWGAIGFFLAVPLTALIRILLENADEGARVAALLGERRR